ncbi:hypothetical protein R3P38DRAFT_1809879 [Favolaschia claudopus]|uniref:DUF6534 domain-containing protein n=1 Tax=Favolaschia claudopus TaxID=2862362 RepID=A0AAW0A4H0_9AGAR
MSSPAAVSHSTLGAMVIGTLVSYTLFGMSTIQVYLYYSGFPDDSRRLKFLVALVWALELAHSICIGQMLYNWLISDYTHPDRLDFLPWGLYVSGVFNACIALCVQGFYSFRIYTLWNSVYVPSLACILALSRLVLNIALVFFGQNVPVETFEKRSGWGLTVNWATGTANDLTIAISLVCWLYLNRSDVNQRTGALFDKIIKWTIQTGALLSATTTVTLICFLTMRKNYVWVAVYVVQARLYSNSFFSSLNSRTTLRAMDQATAATTPLSINELNAVAPAEAAKLNGAQESQRTMPIFAHSEVYNISVNTRRLSSGSVSQ